MRLLKIWSIKLKFKVLFLILQLLKNFTLVIPELNLKMKNAFHSLMTIVISRERNWKECTLFYFLILIHKKVQNFMHCVIITFSFCQKNMSNFCRYQHNKEEISKCHLSITFSTSTKIRIQNLTWKVLVRKARVFPYFPGLYMDTRDQIPTTDIFIVIFSPHLFSGF